jgi:hypothetical protein
MAERKDIVNMHKHDGNATERHSFTLHAFTDSKSPLPSAFRNAESSVESSTHQEKDEVIDSIFKYRDNSENNSSSLAMPLVKRCILWAYKASIHRDPLVIF